jgi:hypothetical protein
MSRTLNVDFFDVKQDLGKILDGAPVPTVYGNSCHTSRLRDPLDRVDSWIGGSLGDTKRWMESGFKAPEFKNAGKYVREAKKKRRTYNDFDGNLNLDRLYAGEEKFFEKRTPKTAKPGMTINVEYCFASMVDEKDIRKYGAWVAGFVGGLEKQGYDLDVNVVVKLDAAYVGDTRQDRTTLLMKVKKQGQKSRFHSWSCLFAPTGFRHIVFHALAYAGGKIGRASTHSIGYTIAGQKWGVAYDRKENVVDIKCNQRAGIDFDALNNDAKACGLL